MNERASDQLQLSEQPLLDTTMYGSGPEDSISDTTENAAVTRHSITINGTTISYIARAGHLITYDQYNARHSAKIFYLSFTSNNIINSSRPVTFFYKGVPRSYQYFYC
jgi:carboxypeptidase C (cathepsin A)